MLGGCLMRARKVSYALGACCAVPSHVAVVDSYDCHRPITSGRLPFGKFAATRRARECVPIFTGGFS